MKCCIDCDKRTPGCHDSCKDYIAESKADRERKEKIRMAKAKERVNQNYVREHYGKQRRRRG